MPAGWTRLNILPDGIVSSDAAIGANSLGDGFMASAYESARGDIVISYAGTTGENAADWLHGNIPAATGITLAAQVLDAANFYLKVLKSVGGDPSRISFTGHSLGGGLASLMAVFFDGDATVFDEAPFAATADSAPVVRSLIASIDWGNNMACRGRLTHSTTMRPP